MNKIYKQSKQITMTTRKELLTKTPELNVERILEKDKNYIEKRRLELESNILEFEETIEAWLITPNLTINGEFEGLVYNLEKTKEKLKTLKNVEQYIQ